MAGYLKDQRNYIAFQLRELSNDWKDKRNCEGMDNDLFFDGFETGSEATRAFVLSVCAACNVKNECLTYGKKSGSSGVWGGHYLNNGKPVKNPYLVGKNGRISQRKVSVIEKLKATG